jgi:AcrR family transcriptional regulator
VPKLWSETVDAHRTQVREAIFTSAIELIAEHGLRAVTMSQIAERARIGRATLYKYFPDLDAILIAWHGRQVTAHLDQLRGIATQPGSAASRLEEVLLTYAGIIRETAARHQGTDLSALVHQGEHLDHAKHQLNELISDLVAEAAAAGDIRADIPAAELASYCLSALGAARTAHSRAAASRLIAVILAGLRTR